MKLRNSKGEINITVVIIIFIILTVLLVGTLIYMIATDKDAFKKEEKSIVKTGQETSSYDKSKTVTDRFEISSYLNFMGKETYSCYIKEEDGSYSPLEIETSKFNLPSNLYDYNADIEFELVYSPDDYIVYECKVIDIATGKEITDLSEENIEKLYNIEYGKQITNKQWSDTIRLSELSENQIYQFIAPEDTEKPEIINDTELNCVVYIKSNVLDKYEKEIYMYNTIDNHFGFSFSEIKSGDSFTIMYKEVNNEQLLKMIETDDIIYLSKYIIDDEVPFTFEDYIYNDTDSNITLSIVENSFSEEVTEITLESNQIYGFDSSVSSVTVKDISIPEES